MFLRVQAVRLRVGTGRAGVPESAPGRTGGIAGVSGGEILRITPDDGRAL